MFATTQSTIRQTLRGARKIQEGQELVRQMWQLSHDRRMAAVRKELRRRPPLADRFDQLARLLREQRQSGSQHSFVCR